MTLSAAFALASDPAAMRGLCDETPDCSACRGIGCDECGLQGYVLRCASCGAERAPYIETREDGTLGVRPCC